MNAETLKVSPAALDLAEEAFYSGSDPRTILRRCINAAMPEIQKQVETDLLARNQKGVNPYHLNDDLFANLKHLGELVIEKYGELASGKPVRITSGDKDGQRRRWCSAWMLKYWGLATSPEKGVHQLTKAGIEFLSGDVLEPKTVKVCDDFVLDQSQAQVSCPRRFQLPA